jgi:hypothetical protein
MATRFFFATDTAAFAPTAGSKSTALPDGTDNSLTANDSQSLLLTANNSASTESINTLAQTARQSGRFARFTSDRVTAQTISANTWTVVIDTRESNGSADAYLALSAYVWRPSTSSVVGYIYDSNAQIGAEWSLSLGAVTYTFSGSAVTAQTGDVVVIEVWYTAAQAKATSYQVQTRYNTSTQYLETPQDLVFQIPPRYFFFT